jgi:transposase
LREEEKFDGYFAVITSEYKASPEEIIKVFKNVGKIEEFFKVAKSDFENRTDELSLREYIGAHCLICFVSLLIIKILEQRLEGKHSVTAMLKSLSKVCCSHIKENYYLFDFYNDVLQDIGKELDIDFGRKIMTFGDIKKIIGQSKKV